MNKYKIRRGLLLFGIVLAMTALGCKVITDLFGTQENEPQPVIQPDEPETNVNPGENIPEEPAPPDEDEDEGGDFEGADNGAGPNMNDQVELDIGGIQLFYDPNLILDIQGEWKEASGSLMSEPWPAYMHYDLLLDAGTINLIEVFSLEYVSASYEMGLDEVEGLLLAQPTSGLECVPEVSRDTAYQQCDHQQFVSNIKYVPFKNGHGVRWVTVYAIQDMVAVSNESLVYRFQGLTDNGECYLKASFRITHSFLPEADMIPNDVYADATGDLLNEYFESWRLILDTVPENFMPTLEHFDAMIESLAVGKCGIG